MHKYRLLILGIGTVWAALGARQGECADTAAKPIRVLIVDGQNNHDWRATTPFLSGLLRDRGPFDVSVATAPAHPETPEGKVRYRGNLARYRQELDQFRPAFANFDVILCNYNGDLWSEPMRQALDDAVRNGKGLVIVHAANNAFPEWPAYQQMLGLGWRPHTFGSRVTVDDQGEITRVAAGIGPSSGHGSRRAFQVTSRDATHPIMRDMPRHWMHARDELYHGLRGPAQDMTVLATAFDDPQHGGTGAHEPLLWTVAYGSGRVFHTTLGHDLNAMRCVGFVTTLLRGTEWAATGTVTQPLPDDFPTADAVRTISQWSFARLWHFWAIPLGGACVGAWAWRSRRQRGGVDEGADSESANARTRAAATLPDVPRPGGY